MESRYLINNGKSTIGIRAAITLELKGPNYFLEKENYMNFKIYINQVLKELSLSFLKLCVEEKKHMILMNNGSSYHTSKMFMK